MGGSQRSTVTLRALIPYLVIYRALGLLPINFASETANPSSKPTTPWLCRFRPRLCWRQIGWTRLYSASVFLLVTGFLFEKLPSLESKGKDVVGRLEVANRSSICLNVFVTSAICFCYVGKRMSALTQKMIQCEHDLIALGCHLQVNYFVITSLNLKENNITKFLESVSSLLLDRFGHWKRGNNLERISDWHKIHPSYNELSNRRRRSINTGGHLSFDYDSLYSWTDAVCRLFSHSTELNLFSLPEAIAKGD